MKNFSCRAGQCVFAAAAVLSLSSCATVFCGSRAKVVFDSNVPVESAVLTIDGRQHPVESFPYQTKIKRGFTDTDVKAEADGYKTVRFKIEKNFNPVSVINLFSLPGWGIDAATGAMMKPDQKCYEIIFRKAAEKESAAE